MKELLKHGLFVDSKDRHGLTAIQVATTENNIDMVQFLLINGSEVHQIVKDNISSTNLNKMLQKREVGHRIVMSETETPLNDHVKDDHNGNEECTKGGAFSSRVSIYKGHPFNRRMNHCTEPGRLIKLPNSMAELKSIAGN